MKIRSFRDIQYFFKVALMILPFSLVFGNNLFIPQLDHLAEAPSSLGERDIHNSLEDGKGQNSLPTNPMELINIWRKSTAMEDATSPSDAIDQALKAFDQVEPVTIEN
tara:strand:+ start:1083 stop:1406 length:324 start_codon:yes stop_codon:yes gene_type:complete